MANTQCVVNYQDNESMIVRVKWYINMVIQNIEKGRKRNIIYIYVYIYIYTHNYIRKSKSHVLWPNTRRDNIIQSSGHGPRYVSKIYQKYTISRVWQSLRNNNWLVYRMSGWCNALPPSYGCDLAYFIRSPPCFVYFALPPFVHLRILDARDDVWPYKGCLWKEWVYRINEVQY